MNALTVTTKNVGLKMDRYIRMKKVYLYGQDEGGRVSKGYVSRGFNDYIITNYIATVINKRYPTGTNLNVALTIDDFDFTQTNYLLKNYTVDKIICAFVVENAEHEKSILTWIHSYHTVPSEIELVFIKLSEIKVLKYNKHGLPQINKTTGEQVYTSTVGFDLGVLTDMKIDLIIANLPYGKIGATITQRIIDSIDFEQYINLLPLKDYTYTLANHINFEQSKVLPPHSFSDADTLTFIAAVSRTVDNKFKNETDFLAGSFIVDKPFIKFMKANALTKHYAFDQIKMISDKSNVTRRIIFHCYLNHSNHTCGTEKLESTSTANKYNLYNDADFAAIFKPSGGSNFRCIEFATAEEKINFIAFYIGRNGLNRNFINRMIANQFISIRDDSVCWPKVDWTRDDWTIEKILKEVANYTDAEIKEVLDTLDTEYTIGKDTDIERLFGQYLDR